MTEVEWQAFVLSLKIASVAVAVALPFAVGAALLLARWKWPGRSLLDALIFLPVVLPPVVVGYLLLTTMGTKAPIGGWLYAHFGIRFIFSWTGAALACGLVTFPLQVRAIRLAIETADPKLLTAAETLGAGPVDRFFTLTLPLAMPGLVAGAITAFATSLGEFGAIITFVSNIPGETQTLPLAIYTALQAPGGEAAAARLAGLSVVLALGGLILAELAARKVKALTGS